MLQLNLALALISRSSVRVQYLALYAIFEFVLFSDVESGMGTAKLDPGQLVGGLNKTYSCLYSYLYALHADVDACVHACVHAPYKTWAIQSSLVVRDYDCLGLI